MLQNSSSRKYKFLNYVLMFLINESDVKIIMSDNDFCYWKHHTKFSIDRLIKTCMYDLPVMDVHTDRP